MLCPKCNSSMLKCIDSRPVKGGSTRRRHVCIKCGHRFTTYEVGAERLSELKLKETLLADVLEYSDKIKEKLKGNTKNENESNA